MDSHQPMESNGRPKRQCTANSRQSGERCKRRPIPGGNVCVIHGGGTPQVRAAAEARIAAAVDPAIAYLIKAAKQKKINAAGITAARDLLDRAGFKPVDKTELSGTVNLQQTAADTIRAKRAARLDKA